MNRIEKERLLKIKNLVTAKKDLAQEQANLRRINEEHIKNELGLAESLVKFHKPITSMMEQQEEGRVERAIDLKKAIDDIIPTLEYNKVPEIEDEDDLGVKSLVYRFDLNRNLNEAFIKEEGFELPSELINKTPSQLETIIDRVNSKNKEIGSKKGQIRNRLKNATGQEADYLTEKVNQLDYQIAMNKSYKKALQTLKSGSEYMGEGVDLLEKLTDKVCNGSKSKNLHNQIAMLLDKLLREGVVSDDYVKNYYETFSKTFSTCNK